MSFLFKILLIIFIISNVFLYCCWMGVHCSIYIGSYNASNVSYFNSSLLFFFNQICVSLQDLIHRSLAEVAPKFR
jgi:hypothetical protein